MCKGKCGKGCTPACIGKILVIIGGINWGLVGIGMLSGGKNFNVVNLIFGGIMWLEAVVYIVVGLAALMMIFGCKCKKCKDGMCAPGMCKDGKCGPGDMCKDGKCGPCKDGKCEEHKMADMKDDMPEEKKEM